MPARDSSLGFLLYYANVTALIAACILASVSGTPLVYAAAAFACLALVAQDVAWLRACHLAPQDRALIEKITALTRERRTAELLRNHDFHRHLTYDGDLDSLQTMRNEWVGVDFEFRNPTCQRAWSDMRGHIEALLKILGDHADYRNAHNFFVPDEAAGEQANRVARQIRDCSERLRKIYIQKMPYG